MSYLIAGTVGGIQRYIFRSGRLAQIQGGSGLVASATKAAAGAVREEEPGAEVVVDAGGLVQIEVEVDAARAQQLAATLARAYASTAPGSRITTAVVPIGASFVDAVREAAILLARRQREETIPIGAGGVITRPCQDCGFDPVDATAPLVHGRRTCAACAARQTAPPLPHPEELSALLGAQPRAQRELEEFAKGAKPENYLAFVVADGNAVGRLLDDVSGKAAYGNLSRELDGALRSAFAKAAFTVAGDAPTDRFPLLPLILAGDDLIALAHPQLGLEFAARFAEGFENETTRRLGAPVTMGVGVVIAHQSFPFNQLRTLGDALKASAKRAWKDSGGASRIDFEIVTASTATPGRLERGRLERRFQTKRPYEPHGLLQLLDLAKKLRQADRSAVKRLPLILGCDPRDPRGRLRAEQDYLVVRSRQAEIAHALGREPAFGDQEQPPVATGVIDAVLAMEYS